MSEYHWWNCGMVVYVADTENRRVVGRRVRSPGVALRKFGLDTLRIGLRGEIFDGKSGPGPNVFPTLAEAAEYMADHYAKRAEMDPSAHWCLWYSIRAADWRAVAKRSRAAMKSQDDKVSP